MVPWASISIILFIVKRIIRPNAQAGFSLKQRYPVDPASGCGDVLFESPTQASVKIQLAIFGGGVSAVAGAGKGVIARAIHMRLIKRYGVGILFQIFRIKINNIRKHRLAPFFGVKAQHFADAARFTERIEQIFGIIAEIQPLSGCSVNHPIDGGL